MRARRRGASDFSNALLVWRKPLSKHLRTVPQSRNQRGSIPGLTRVGPVELNMQGDRGPITHLLQKLEITRPADFAPAEGNPTLPTLDIFDIGNFKV